VCVCVVWEWGKQVFVVAEAQAKLGEHRREKMPWRHHIIWVRTTCNYMYMMMYACPWAYPYMWLLQTILFLNAEMVLVERWTAVRSVKKLLRSSLQLSCPETMHICWVMLHCTHLYIVLTCSVGFSMLIGWCIQYALALHSDACSTFHALRWLFFVGTNVLNFCGLAPKKICKRKQKFY